MRDNDTHGNESLGKRPTLLRRAGPLAAALAGAALLAAAWSGGSPNPSAGAGSPGGSERTSALAYSQCMRAHGIKNFPDPSAGGGINISGGQGNSLAPPSPHFPAADKTRKSPIPASPLPPPPQAPLTTRHLQFPPLMPPHRL